MASRRPTADVEDMRQMREQMAELRALIERQQAEIAVLRAELIVVRSKDIVGPVHPTLSAPSAHQQRRQREASRRRLLASAGVAAAATVALIASEGQTTHAAPTSDGNNLVLGTTGDPNNTASSTTTLSVAGSNPSPLLKVDASGSAYTSATAIEGISNVQYGTGVYGVGSSTGVAGNCSGSGGYGVSGGADGSGSAGVVGHSNGGFGVWGIAPGGTALVGWGVIDLATGTPGVVGSGRIFQGIRTTPGAPSGSGTAYSAGESIRDSLGELWLCVQGGSPGHWVQASHAVYGYTGGATSYLSKPIRLLDTRSGSTDALTNGGGPYTAGGSPYPVTISGVSFSGVTVPSSCAGAIGNVTVVAGSGGGGYLALVPHGTGFSGTANLAYGAGQIVSNSFNVGLSSDGKLDIIIGGNPTDVILDLFAVVA